MKSREETVQLLQKLITQKQLAKTGKYPIKEKRYKEFLKNPERTSIDDEKWFIYLPTCFNDCLDIAKTDRVVTDPKTSEKQTQKVWTQGSRFAFHRGCILYDTPKAYQNWSQAIQEIKYCISINSAENAKPAMGTEERNSGKVEFSIFSIGYMSNKLETRGDFTFTQDEFVKFLIMGNSDIFPI